MSASVELTIVDSVAVVTLNDVARKNAMTVELGEAFKARVKEVLGQAVLPRAVVITGAGGAFSAGGDLKMLEDFIAAPAAETRDSMRAFYARFLSLLELPMPVIAAIEGPAIGAGLCVATACDLLVVSEEAKLAFNFVKLGLHPGMGATYFVPRRLGAQRAASVLLSGRMFDGREAVTLGLAMESTPKGQALERAMAIAKDLAAASPLAVRALKANLHVDHAELDAALARESEAQAVSYKTRDFAEGIAALKARRTAVFEGR